MKRILLLIGLIPFVLMSCSDDFPVIDDFGNKNYELINQEGKEVLFPKVIEGKIGVVGYIFTNCPDICPLTTNNMRLIQERLKEENIKGVEFVSISFDPEIDRPHVLKRFAEIRKLDLSNWQFLTGEKAVIDSLIKKIGVIAVVGDSIVIEGKITYFYVHTDRISLVDRKGQVRKNYLGSKVNPDEVVQDIKSFVE